MVAAKWEWSGVLTITGERFAQAENVIWDTDEDGDHIAMFLLSGKDMSAQFHEDGEWVSTTTYIDQAEIDLIALTTHKRGVIERLFNPSIARKMIFHSYVPLLIFHS